MCIPKAVCSQQKCCYFGCQTRTCIITYGVLTGMLLLPVSIGAPIYYRDRLSDINWAIFFALNIMVTLTLTLTFIGGLCADNNTCRWAYFWSYVASIVGYIGFYVGQGAAGVEQIPSLGENSALKVMLVVLFILCWDGWLLSLIGSWCTNESKAKLEMKMK